MAMLTIKHVDGAAGCAKIVIKKGKVEATQPRVVPVVAGKAGKKPSFSLPSMHGSADGGRYRIDEIIGEGGTGRVCKAYDTLLCMDVAIKFLNPDVMRDEEAINALKKETRISLSLMHKHIIRIFNLEKRGTNYMLIMEYLKGKSLFSIMSEYPNGMPLEFVAQIVAVATNALSYAHSHDVLHKDITPGNFIITDDGVLKLIDFGIADTVMRQKNSTDFVVGTPIYMSPEQLRGEMLDCRTDIYSLGVLVTQMLTGHTVNVESATEQDLAYTPHPRIVGLDKRVADVLETATAFSPADRWNSMDEFASAFSLAAAAVSGV